MLGTLNTFVHICFGNINCNIRIFYNLRLAIKSSCNHDERNTSQKIIIIIDIPSFKKFESYKLLIKKKR